MDALTATSKRAFSCFFPLLISDGINIEGVKSGRQAENFVEQAGETDANWGNAPVARNVGIEKRAANGFKAARRARRLDGERFSA